MSCGRKRPSIENSSHGGYFGRITVRVMKFKRSALPGNWQLGNWAECSPGFLSIVRKSLERSSTCTSIREPRCVMQSRLSTERYGDWATQQLQGPDLQGRPSIYIAICGMVGSAWCWHQRHCRAIRQRPCRDGNELCCFLVNLYLERGNALSGGM